MDKLSNLRNLGEPTKPEPVERVKVTLRVASDVAEALYVGKVRGMGTLAEQIEALVRARETAAER